MKTKLTEVERLKIEYALDLIDKARIQRDNSLYISHDECMDLMRGYSVGRFAPVIAEPEEGSVM